MHNQFDRRDVVKALLAISATGALGACADQTAIKTDNSASKSALKYGSDGAFFDVQEFALLTALVDTIIPQTDTPGALAGDVPATLQSLASDWGNDDYRRYWRVGLARLDQYFLKIGGQSFTAQTVQRREALLTKYDADVFAGRITDDFYKDMKSTAATAYYMSEPGATEDLIYEAVPGEWKGCIPFSDVGRTWAT